MHGNSHKNHPLYQQGASGAASDLFVIQRPTWQVNRTITRESLESEFLADPDYARREYGAEWIEGVLQIMEALRRRVINVGGDGFEPTASSV